MKRGQKLFLTAVITFVVLIGGVYVGGTTDSGHNFIHGLIFGHDRVYYHHKGYADPETLTTQQVNQQLGQAFPTTDHRLMETGDTIVGLPLYETGDNANGQVPQDLFLKETDGDFLVYRLIIPK